MKRRRWPLSDEETTTEHIQIVFDAMVEHGLAYKTDSQNWNPRTGTFDPVYKLTPQGEAAAEADMEAVERDAARKWQAAKSS